MGEEFIMPDKFLYPWESEALLEWSIVGMNHFTVLGERFLYVAMTKNDKCIYVEGKDHSIWDELNAQAKYLEEKS